MRRREKILLLFGQALSAIERAVGFSFLANKSNPSEGFLKVIKPSDGSGDFDFDREGGVATVMNKDGVIEVVADDIASIDYTNGFAELLREPISNNQITHTTDFSTSYWRKLGFGTASIIHTPNYALAPDGTMTASRFQMNLNGGLTSSDACFLGRLGNYASTIQTQSIWVKSLSGEPNVYSDFNGAVPKVFKVTNEWQRISNTNLSFSPSTREIRFVLLRGSYGLSSQSADILVWGAQLEPKPYATSFMPDIANVAQSRSFPSITDGGNVNVINSEEGTLFFEGSDFVDDGTFENRYITISSGASTNRIIINFRDLIDSLAVVLFVNGNVEFNHSVNGINKLKNLKITFVWKENECSLWLNGFKVISDNLAVMPASNIFNQITFAQYDNLSNYFYGRCRELTVYNRAFTDAEVREVNGLIEDSVNYYYYDSLDAANPMIESNSIGNWVPSGQSEAVSVLDSSDGDYSIKVSPTVLGALAYATIYVQLEAGVKYRFEIDAKRGATGVEQRFRNWEGFASLPSAQYITSTEWTTYVRGGLTVDPNGDGIIGIKVQSNHTTLDSLDYAVYIDNIKITKV